MRDRTLQRRLLNCDIAEAIVEAKRTAGRLPAIDLLRGLVMVLMTLDHVRDYFSDALWYAPTDLTKASGPLFLTRWVTHFCAPVFVLLAGVGAALSEQRGLSKPQLARFLVLRGLWLVLLELTVVRLGFYFTFDFREIQGLVIWVLGWCMVLLAAIQFLPRPVILIFALFLIANHNAFDDVQPEEMGRWDRLWMILHAHGTMMIGGVKFAAPYKIIPWVGVMALGYALGPLFQLEQSRRRFMFCMLGCVAIAAFGIVRGINDYGNPTPWKPQNPPIRVALSFLNCEKYPPSLDYLLMTLGPAFLALAAFDRPPGWLARRIIVLGRVPLFYYILHLPLIHILAIAASYIDKGAVAPWLLSPPAQAQADQGYGYPLPIVYAVWLLVILLLYPLCVRFAALKRKYPGGILSYL